MISFTMTGLADLKERMRKVSIELSSNAIKSSLAATGNELKKILVAAAPYDGVTPDGVHINENMQVSFSRSRSGLGRIVVTVGVKYGKSPRTVSANGKKRGGRKNEGSAFYWKFIEFGTSKQQKKSFIRPAFEAAAPRLLKIFEQKMAKAMTRIENKAARRAKP